MKLVLSWAAPNVQIMDGPLTDTEAQVLAFERGRWKHQGAKDTAILETFGVLPVRYYQLLNLLIDKPAAVEADPLLVNRLRRLRATRRGRRTAED